MKNDPTCLRLMLSRNTVTDSTTTAVVAPRRAKRLSGAHATASGSTVPSAAPTERSQFAAPRPPKTVERARMTQFVATVVNAMNDAYTC